MNTIYNSTTFCVVEICAMGAGLEKRTGFEIIDKSAKREIFIEGLLADRFREEVSELAGEGEATMEEIDDYLASFQSLMSQPMSVH
jgi:hypothetical protein